MRALFRVRSSRVINPKNTSKTFKLLGSTKTVFNENSLLTVHNIYYYSSILETYKILRSERPICMMKDVFILSNQKDHRLKIPKGRLDTYSDNFCFQAPILWNNVLTSNIITNFSFCFINSFKRQLKSFFLKMQKCFDSDTWHIYNNNILQFLNHMKTNIYEVNL